VTVFLMVRRKRRTALAAEGPAAGDTVV
jgi:hypothetical protein